MERFSLHWRFDANHCGLASSDLLSRVRALGALAAATVDERATAYCGEGGPVDVTFRSDDSPAEVTRRLRELPPLGDVPVLLSWDAQTAVVTTWEVFVTHWDDFCYSMSDDVTVMPLGGKWVLCYRHYDVMQFTVDSSGALGAMRADESDSSPSERLRA